MWNYQTVHRRLVLLLTPAKMQSPGLDEMRRLHELYYKMHSGERDPGLYEQDGPRDPVFQDRVEWIYANGAPWTRTPRSPTRRAADWR